MKLKATLNHRKNSKIQKRLEVSDMDSHSILQYMQSVSASDQVVARFYHLRNWTNQNSPFTS